MNENARKWVSALRSGEYGQTSGRLRNENSFCCLGVACDLYAKEHPEAKWNTVPETGFVLFQAVATEIGNSNEGYLPREVVVWLGLTSSCGYYGKSSLSTLNDNGKSFAQIAEVIEYEPEGLFIKDA